MCSIAGIWRLSGKSVSPHEIQVFNDATSYRGPDGAGTFIDPQARNLALGHRRLSILDLSDAGKQPMFSADGNLVITYNGEIYNYLELKAELASKGYTFKSSSDTEVILAAYQEWGERSLLKFNGMWAFAIWDIKKRSLFLSRDRFGVKPLYYVHRPNKLFAFSSESIAFKQLEGFKRSFDSNNVDLGIRNSFYLESVGETIYEGIKKLLPGHCIKIEGRKFEITKWWKTEDHLLPVPDSYNEQIEMFKDIFMHACRLRLRSDVPIGVALSGGLDSSTVYCTIQKIFEIDKLAHKQDNTLWRNAFIACFPDTKVDEQYYADEVINYTHGKANYIYPNEADISSAIYNETKAEDYIYLSPPVVHSIYREMRNSNVIVSLDGHGADEILFGYPDMVNNLIDRKKKDARHKVMLDTWADMVGVSYDYAEMFFAPREAAPSMVAKQSFLSRYIPEKYKRIYRNLKNNENNFNSWLRHNPYYKSGSKPNYPKFEDKGLNICYHELHVKLPTLLRNWDRASMRHGVEIRVPFLDWRLVTFLMSLPDTAKVGDGFTKKIVRDAMKGWMPDTVRLRKNKIGINAPLEEWFNGPMASFILDVVNSQSFLQSTIWNGPHIRNYVEAKTKAREWIQKDALDMWPYLNAWILMQ